MRPVRNGTKATYKDAHSFVTKALRAGTLTRQPCARCGSLSSVAHHEDYSKPLDVTWLCRRHHMLRHTEIGVIRKPNITTVVLPADLAEAVDNYRFDHRLNTRPDAIRELLAYALDRKLADKPAKEKTR